MNKERKQKLVDLGAESLADALLKLAEQPEAAADLIERLIATPKENAQRFKKKLARLKRPHRFIHRGESSGYAGKLIAVLEDLKDGISDPLTGVQLVASFYGTDKYVMEACDDSYGNIGDVYRFDARKLFVEYASLCEDKKKIVDIILKLNKKDGYGVRDSVVGYAIEYLPEPMIRLLIKKLQKLSDSETDEYEQRDWLRLIESLARQIKDAPLFEQTRIASWPTLTAAACVDIARVYLDRGDTQTSLAWLEKVPKNETFQARERNELLIDIYKQLGEKEKLAELLYQEFKSCHSIKSLDDLLDVIGNDKRGDVISNEVTEILAKKNFNSTDAEFLILIGQIHEAEKYILERAEQLDGDLYMYLFPLAKNMESEGSHLAASMIYRSLLSSILERRYSKAYTQGTRHLKKLDQLATSISDWSKFDNHETFKKQIEKKHGRKSSFWAKYTTQKN